MSDAENQTQIDVHIHGRRYSVRADGDAERIRELASIVDEKMRKVHGHGLAVDSLKVAVLAALNLADDLWQMRQSHEKQHRQWLAAQQRMLASIDGAMSGEFDQVKTPA